MIPQSLKINFNFLRVSFSCIIKVITQGTALPGLVGREGRRSTEHFNALFINSKVSLRLSC